MHSHNQGKGMTMELAQTCIEGTIQTFACELRLGNREKKRQSGDAI